MMYPLVQELAERGVPREGDLRGVGLLDSGLLQVAAKPICDRDWDDAHLTNVIVDIHDDDPEFGYRFISDELERAGHEAGESRVHRLCREPADLVDDDQEGPAPRKGPRSGRPR